MTRGGRPGRLVRALLDMTAELDRDGTVRRAEQVGPGLAVSPGGTEGSSEPLESAAAETEEPPVTMRETDDGLLVVATLPGVAEVELSTDLDREVGVLTLGVDGEVVDRVPLEDGGWTITDVAFNDGVFEVMLEAA